MFCVFQGNRGERETSAKRELRARGGKAILPFHVTRARLAFASVRQEYAKNHAVLQANNTWTVTQEVWQGYGEG